MKLKKGEVIIIDKNYGHNYYEKNKEKLLQYNTEKISCHTCN